MLLFQEKWMVGASKEHLVDMFTKKSLLTILASGMVVEGEKNINNYKALTL